MKFSVKNLPIAKQHSLLVVSLALLAFCAFIFDSAINSFFVYQYQLISQGELWRLFTGHFFHTNGFHLLLNLSALVLLWALHGQFYTVKNYGLLLFSCAAICSLGLFYFSPEIKQYVGLSGVLHGVFVFGAMMDIRHGDKTGYLLLLGLVLKIAHEQYYGASQDVKALIDANVAIDAHLWGAVGGLFFTGCYTIIFFRQLKQ